ncbi:MAG: hypothetical protein FWD57_07160 [Polyangiaceae bacterium]|nr:hypothetical protein [Polyangiaceae bacterium]
MKRLKIYLDTTVVSCLDQQDAPDKMADTHKLWDKVKAGVFDVCLSEITIAEANDCTEPKRATLFGYLDQIEYAIIETTERTTMIARRFIDLGVLRPKSFDDCQHIAAAIVSECDVIVSWNFKHIVNHKTMMGVRAIAALEGFDDVLIYTPSVLVGGDDDDI